MQYFWEQCLSLCCGISLFAGFTASSFWQEHWHIQIGASKQQCGVGAMLSNWLRVKSCARGVIAKGCYFCRTLCMQEVLDVLWHCCSRSQIERRMMKWSVSFWHLSQPCPAAFCDSEVTRGFQCSEWRQKERASGVEDRTREKQHL